ncbi:hypothetical protein Cni_G08610 [Canna indica]|uniref:WWE domain-containing protein n=1 Tax=Canna indica TaxID=4628 RepID=A0AAQ3K2G5_9LILI|nr:hypothetical protein Cni_G08610 [Canna indica]
MALSRQFQRSNNNTLIREFKNFKRRSTPARILFFRNGSWIDFTPAVFDTLRSEFVAGKTAFELPIAAYSYVFDFLTMSQVNMEIRILNSIAWVDAHDRCFFPALAVDERRNLLRFDKGASPAALFKCDSTECHREARTTAGHPWRFSGRSPSQFCPPSASTTHRTPPAPSFHWFRNDSLTSSSSLPGRLSFAKHLAIPLRNAAVARRKVTPFWGAHSRNSSGNSSSLAQVLPFPWS